MIELFAELAPRRLALPARPVRWVAGLSRVGSVGGSLGGALALGLGARRALAVRRRVALRPTRGFTRGVVHDLSLATAFGGVVFGKLALDPAARVLRRPEDRGRMVTAPWRAFAWTSGVSLTAAAITWLAGGRSRALRAAPDLTHAKDALLAVSLATGAVNAAAGLKLARANGVPMESGAEPSPEAGQMAMTHRIGLWSGYAHMLALAGTIAVGSLLDRA
jgi:hypothetical protein